MSGAVTFANDFARSRLVVIIRLVDHANVVAIVETLAEAGVRFLEVTIERETGLKALERAVEACGDQLCVGAGTVRTVSEVERVTDVGAKFLVMPDTNPDVISAGVSRGLVTLPGAMTPSEVARADAAGADYVKLFPASTVGFDHLRALRGPFPSVMFVPTGGVSMENATQLFDVGAVAVAMGSILVPGSGSLDGLFERAQAAVEVTRA